MAIEITRAVEIPNDARLVAEGAIKFCESVAEIKCRTAEEYSAAVGLFKQISEHITMCEATRKEIKQPYIQAGRDIDEYFGVPNAALVNLKRRLDSGILEYEREERRKRDEEQRRINAIAEEKRKREEAEAAKQRARADALRAEGREREAALADARAENREVKAAAALPAVVQSALPETEGIARRETWHGEVSDPKAAKSWALENKRFEFLSFDETAWNKFGSMTKEEREIPGARIYRKVSVVKTK